MSISQEIIELEADKLNEISSQYYLSHAVTGCEKMLEQNLSNSSKISCSFMSQSLPCYTFKQSYSPF